MRRSTYAVNLNPATSSSLANVSGVATLGGATVNAIFANGSYIQKQYTILNAASISGGVRRGRRQHQHAGDDHRRAQL